MTDDNSASQALAQFQSIAEMVKALNAADKAREHNSGRDTETACEEARQAIEEDALSVQVRSAWYSPGSRRANVSPAEYEILLCTGGPAVRIIGDLNEHGEPENAKLQHQDWGTPWTDWNGRDTIPATWPEIEPTLLAYARTFYFAD